MISSVFEIFVLSMVSLVSCLFNSDLTHCVCAGGLLRCLYNQFAGAELQEKTGEGEEDGLGKEFIS